MTIDRCTIRVALAEDHRLVREGLTAVLASDPCFHFVGEASDGLQAIELVDRLKPDVLLLDLRIPRLHGIEVLRQICDRSSTAVVVVSVCSDESYIMEALRNGARGYVLKESSSSELAHAIHTVATGGQYISESLRQKALNASLKRFVPGGAAPQLTPREVQVLELAADGRSSQEVAAALFISRRTAEAHRANLMKKLALKTQTDLVLYAVRKGLIAA